MKKKSIGINAILNTIRSALSVLFPLITYPYAVRVLHVEGIGRFNYAESIVSYFALIAALGVATYAVREGAKIRDSKKEFQQFANEVFTVNILTTLIAYGLLIVCILCVKKFHSYSMLIAVSSVSMVLTTLGIDWVNTVYEDFLFVTIRSVMIHLVSMALLFLCVHSADDLYKYAALNVISNGIICLSNYIYCRKYVKLRVVKTKTIFRHLKPMLVLFANNLAVSIYVNADTTMLGWFKGDYSVGLYSVAVKIYKIIKTILAAIYNVTIPRLANYAGSGEIEKLKNLFSSIVSIITILLIPTGVGLIAISYEIVFILAGNEYIEAVSTLKLLGIALIFSIFGGIITCCLNIPLGREAYNMKATIISAFINIGLNFLAIPLWGINGAALTTIISELFVPVFCIMTFNGTKAYIDWKLIMKNFSQAIIGSVYIVIIACLAKQLIGNMIIRLIVVLGGSVLLYTGILLMFHNRYAIYLLQKMKSKCV